MTQIAIVVYPNFTALDFIGPYEVLRMLPDADVRFVWHEPGPITADSGVLIVGATHSLAETPAPDVILGARRPRHRRSRSGRSSAGMAAPSAQHGNVDDVGVFRVGRPGCGGIARRQTGHLALVDPGRTKGLRRHPNR